VFLRRLETETDRAALWLKQGTPVLHPQLLAVICPQAWRARFAIEDHRLADVISKHRRIGDELDGVPEASGTELSFRFGREINHTKNLSVLIPGSQTAPTAARI
jgi:hypothetical protein